jgi:lipoprotein-anchoring transpeptidase ErfK/SrfK
MGQAHDLLNSMSMKPLSTTCSAVALSCIMFATGAQAQPVKPVVGKSAPTAAATPDPMLVFGSLDQRLRQGLALQVALDRAGFSPGEIDGKPGRNTERAAAAARQARGGDVAPDEQPLTTYTITPEDAAGPFADVPQDMMEKSKLPSLGYASLLELLGERFHTSPSLLEQLNPSRRFDAGAAIIVPNVEPFVVTMPAKDSAPVDKAAAKNKAASDARGESNAGSLTVTVTEQTDTLQVADASGRVIFHAPVTVGSQHDPLPVGEWKVNGVSRYPTFHYNPDLFWDADPSHAKARLAPGPNNPVGVVWIDLSKEHYGIHGTPEPSRIAYTESHGCIRLTNWDAMRLASLVGPGTKVVLR